MTRADSAGLAAMPRGFTALHADAGLELSAWVAPTPRLATLRDSMIAVLGDDPTAMWRGRSPVHFTAGLVVLDPACERVALTLHRKAKRWFQFGGHFEDGDPSVAAAAYREGCEESGLRNLRLIPGIIQVDAHDLPGVFGHCRRHLDLRYAAVGQDGDLIRSDESDEVRWWSVDALPPGAEASLREAVALAQDAVRHSG